MDHIELSNIYNIYSTTDKKDHPKLLGRVVVTPTEMSVVADYDNLFQSLNGPVTPETLRRFAQWCDGSHSFGVSLQELKEGKHPEVIPEKKLPDTQGDSKPEDDEKWFKVHRDDLDDPMLIKFKQGKAYIADSDSPLDPQELHRMLDLASQGKASIRHHKPMEQMVDMLKSLSKAEAPVQDDKISQHLFRDPISPGLGNLKSFHDEPDEPGVYVILKGNDLSTVSRMHGHKMHEDAHRATSSALVDALKEHGGQGWRLHSDQYAAHLPSHESAAQFLRSLRGKLESVTPVGGTHKLSMNSGIGDNPVSAKLALDEAEKAKVAGKHLPGNAPGYSHGPNGPISVESPIPKQP